MGLKATWDRLGTLGVEEHHSMHERRRIVVLNRALLIGVVVSISYLFIYAYADAAHAVEINAVAVLVYAGALLLNRLFDKLAERHGLEKIKTIGDAYMVAGGLPTPRPDHAHAIAEMALDMADSCTAIPGPATCRYGFASASTPGPSSPA